MNLKMAFLLGLIPFYAAIGNSTAQQTDSFESVEPVARAGNADAQFRLGLMYYMGDDAPKDYKRAFEWFTKAAEQGNASAQWNLGTMFRYGEGVPQDYKEAFEWYTKAAEQGEASAQWSLGTMYANGLGVPQNNETARDWYSKASVQGDEAARLNLRDMNYERWDWLWDWRFIVLALVVSAALFNWLQDSGRLQRFGRWCWIRGVPYALAISALLTFLFPWSVLYVGDAPAKYTVHLGLADPRAEAQLQSSSDSVAVRPFVFFMRPSHGVKRILWSYVAAQSGVIVCAGALYFVARNKSALVRNEATKGKSS